MGSSSPLHPYCLSSATHLTFAFALHFLLLPPSPSSLSLFFRCPLSFRYAPIRPLAVPLMSVDDAS